MSNNTLHILTEANDTHQLFVEDLQKQLSDFTISTEYIDNPNGEKLSDQNVILDQLNKEVAVLLLGKLPFPLKDEFKVECLIKAKNDSYFAFIIRDGAAKLPQEILHQNCIDQLGEVFLVGAGQSDKSLLTLRAHDLLATADIIFYDSLIDISILELSQAEKVFVGKRANKHYKDQKDINQLLFEAALSHKTVVRIKGGDPMIFGHAGEEIAYLESRLIKVSTVPGISSPLGGASWANLPLTMRNISNSVSFCSAHEKSKILVPNTDTIVYFMGASNLPNIAKALKKNGKAITTPLTLFYNIGANDAEVYHETIDSVLTENKVFKSPLLIVVGEVGNRKNWHKSFHYKPKILFTGSHIKKYADLGYVFHQPMIEIVPLQDYSEVDKSITELENYNLITFTSMYAVDHFFARFNELGHDSRKLSNVKIASIGSVTSSQLKKQGIIPDLQATEESSEGLIKLFKNEGINKQNILIPRSDLAMDYLPIELEKAGNKVNRLVVYKNQMPVIAKKVEIENFDQIIFTSPSGVDNFMKVYKQLPNKPEIITRGKETAKRVESYK